MTNEARARTHEETERDAAEALSERYHVRCNGCPMASTSTSKAAKALLKKRRAEWLAQMHRRGHVRVDAKGVEHWRTPFRGDAWDVLDTAPSE